MYRVSRETENCEKSCELTASKFERKKKNISYYDSNIIFLRIRTYGNNFNNFRSLIRTFQKLLIIEIYSLKQALQFPQQMKLYFL